MTVSGLPASAIRRFCWQVDNDRAFPAFCAKTKNGFVAQENCFMGRAGRNNSGQNLNNINEMGQRRRPLD